MTDLPHPWDMYAFHQQQLTRRSVVDDRAWGLEAGLNMLCDIPIEEVTADELRRTTTSASRRDRYRASLLQPKANLAATISVNEVETRSELRYLRRILKASDFTLLTALAFGWTYKEIAPILGVRPSALRARTARARHTASMILGY